MTSSTKFLIILSIGFIFLFLSFYEWRRITNLKRRGFYTEARVIQLLPTADHTVTPVFEYQDSNGRQRIYQSVTASYPAPYSVGEIVPVIVYNNGRNIIVQRYLGLYGCFLFYLVVSLPFIVIGGGYFIYAHHMVEKS